MALYSLQFKINTYFHECNALTIEDTAMDYIAVEDAPSYMYEGMIVEVEAGETPPTPEQMAQFDTKTYTVNCDNDLLTSDLNASHIVINTDNTIDWTNLNNDFQITMVEEIQIS